VSDGKFKILLLAVLVAILLALGAMALGFHDTQVAAQEAHRGLCELKGGYLRQLHDTKKALAAKPGTHLHDLVEQFGRKVILNSEKGLEQRVADMRDVTCP
jgi:hypothetical protein